MNTLFAGTKVTKAALAVAGLSVVALSSGVQAQGLGKISGNEFNPAISLILDARYTDINNSELELPGFVLGGEAGLPSNGFATGHNELVMSANIDDNFFGTINMAIVHANGTTAIELEEAFIQTLALGNGFTIKAGQFFSGIGYLNSIHDHAHDFADRPLVYDALFGGHLMDTGVQTTWVAPTDTYLSFGAELTSGSKFPSGESEDNNKGRTFFVKTGGDIGISSSWLLGASYYETEFDVREAGGHHHHGAEAAVAEVIDNELLNGELDIAGIDFVYKWAPKGNNKQTNFKFQAEYFVKNESGLAEFVEGDASAEAMYDGKQEGFYVQTVYQFMPAWRVGLRYDHLKADNKFSDFEDNGIDEEEFIEESGYGTADDPKKFSIMLDYAPSHFSRLRLQYSELDNGHDETYDIITLQYSMSLGSHGAHTF